MGEKFEELRAWVTAYPTSTVPMLHGAVAEHDAELAALRERVEKAEEGLSFEKQVAHGLSLSLDNMRADRDRLAAELAKAEADRAEAVARVRGLVELYEADPSDHDPVAHNMEYAYGGLRAAAGAPRQPGTRQADRAMGWQGAKPEPRGSAKETTDGASSSEARWPVTAPRRLTVYCPADEREPPVILTESEARIGHVETIARCTRRPGGWS